MSITEEGTGPSNEPATSRNSDKPPSAQNGANQPGQGLPGLAAFGQMQGYQPVGSEQQEPAVAEVFDPFAEAESEVAPLEPTFVEPSPLEPDPFEAASFDSAPIAPEPETASIAPEAAPITPEPVEPAPPVNITPHDNGAEDPYSADTQIGVDHQVPDFLNVEQEVPEASPAAPTLMDDIQSYMNERQDAYDETHVQGGHEAFDASALHQGDTADAAALCGDGQAIQTFEAHYDQHPEIPLGAFEQPGEPQPEEQPFFEQPKEPAGDADFMASEAAPEVAPPPQRRGRKILMAASGLVGVLALGGALAFAYKIGGDSDIAKAGKPPLIQADSRPVKVAPDSPGGKEFPHKNKKIYERLGGKDGEEVVKIKPRQEDIAAAATAAVGSPDGAQAAKPSATAPGAPRRVKTLTVRPDGTIGEASPQVAAATPATPPRAVVSAPDGTVAMTFPSAPPAAAPAPAAPAQTTAAIPGQPVTPKIPTPAAPPPAAEAPPPPAPQQQAAVSLPVQKPQVPRAAAPSPAAAQPAAGTGTGNYVVQVAARKSQTDALAAFADIQQKYPRLLSGYRPIIKRADLGNKGVWYRLNVGPVESKQVAGSLCGKLKSAGMRSCLVRSQ